VKLETDKANLKALNLRYSRASIQQGLFSEHLGAMAQSEQLLNNPEFKPHIDKLNKMSQAAQTIYLKENPTFAKAFENALRPHVEAFGGVSKEFEDAFGDDVQPKLLSSLKEQIDGKLRSRQEVFERDGEIPQELNEEMAGLEVVRKARQIQYEWMKDPFNKDKINLMRKAQQNIKIAADVAGKTITGVQDERAAFAQTKFTAEQLEKQASGFYQDAFITNLNKGHNDNKAAELASKATREKFGDEAIFKRDAENFDAKKKPLVENKISVGGEQEFAKKFAGHVAETDSKMLDAARQAPEIHDRASRVMDILSNKNVITGFGADFKLDVAKALKAAGLSTSDAPENTEVLFTELAESTLAAIKASGLGSGNGFTNTDREYLEKAKGGRINLEKDSLIRIAKISQRVAELTADKWNKRVKQIPESALSGTGITKDPIVLNKQASPAKSEGAVIKSLPQGSKQIGTSNGKPVYQTPDGKRFIGD
jgi:hypothetical protein